LAIVSLGLGGVAAARPPAIYINDVRVDGLHGQTLSNVDVAFDEHGDVRITAKGYKITKLDSAPSPAAPAPPPAAAASPPAASAPAPTAPAPTAAATSPAARHFYIATLQPSGREGMAGWNVDVYINQVFVKRFQSKDPDPLFEVTRFLKTGANVIHFTPRREAGEARSSSPGDWFELVLGDGEMRAGQVMLTKIGAYRRTAAESTVSDTEMTLNVAVQ
jgi:hypothetical protein